MNRVLVIESDQELAASLEGNLEIEGYEVRTAPGGAAGLHVAGDLQPDLLVLDLDLDDAEGLRILRRARQQHPSMRIMAVSRNDAEADKVRALHLGADDYLTRPFGLMEFLARVAALLRRAGRGAERPHLRRAVEKHGELELHFTAHQVRRSGQVLELTPKEYDLLVALVRRRGAVASREELLREVWGYSDDVVSRTVDTHISGLRHKLEEDPSSPVYIETVRKAGYRFSAADGGRESPDESGRGRRLTVFAGGGST